MDRDRVVHAFYEYTDSFDSSNLQIRNKKRHTLHVANNSEYIARNLCLSDNDIDISWLIGMLHDIGRFEQIKRMNSYDDRTGMDHAEFGCKLLFKEGLINRFIDVKDIEFDWMVVNSAIKNHNKLNLPRGLSKRELLFCNIIRDADKVDIFRGFLENDFLSFHEHTKEEVQESQISEEVMNCFREHRTIPVEVATSAADRFLMSYALYYELEYECSRDLVENQGFYKRMLKFEFLDSLNQHKFNIIKSEILRYMKLEF